MAFSFGTPANNNKQGTSFNFGNSTPSQTPSLFGTQQANSATPSSNFSFGANNTQQSQSQSQSKPAFSFGSGATNSSSNTGTPAFSFGTAGNSNNTNNSNSHNPNNNNNNNNFGQSNPAQPNSNGNLFGQTNVNNGASSGLFGVQNPQQSNNIGNVHQTGQSLGLFGSNTQAGQGSAQPFNLQQPNLFGNSVNNATNTNNNNNSNTQSQGQNQPSITGLFAQGQQSQQSQQNQYSQVAQAQQPSMAQSIYGQPSSQPQFSWSRPAQSLNQSTMPSFSMPSTSLGQSRFNPSQSYNPGFASSLNAGNNNFGNNTYGPSQPASIQEQLLRLKNAWDPTSPDCSFQAYFYNRVAPETASLYTKPEDHKQGAWDDAVSNRPDNSVVPVLAKGFTALQTRVKSQEQQIYAYRTRIHEIANKLKELMDRHTLHATPKIDTARRRHLELSRRAMQLATKVQVLKCRGYALRPEEDQLRTQLQTLDQQLHDPATFGRVGELWAKMTLLRLKQKAAEDDIKARGYITTIDFDSGNSLEKIEQALRDQNNGLAFVSGIVKDDLAKVEGEIQKFQSTHNGLDKSKGRQ